MMMMMATNCSNTRSRISFCDVLGEPPRNMLIRPSSNTNATAPIATGTKICDMNWLMTKQITPHERECHDPKYDAVGVQP
jgi:hypothetical protein